MLERLAGLETEFADVEARLADPDVFADQSRYRELATRHKELDAIVSRYRELRKRTDDLELAKQMLSDSAGDDRELHGRKPIPRPPTSIGSRPSSKCCCCRPIRTTTAT